MKTRSLWLLWTAALGFFIALVLYPVSNRATRVGSALLLLVIWAGLMALLWKQRWVRFGLFAVAALSAAFLILPARNRDSDALRRDYVTGLQHYEGTKYVWGGESPRGIDCSGLIRRGLIDSMFCQGIRSFDGGLVRTALSLWWNDCSAKALGEQHDNLTEHLLDVPSINALDHSKLLAGDIAVTSDGQHVMAYLGDNRWIEADPNAGRVITVSVPSSDNHWFRVSMKIMRWKIFE